MVVTAGGTAGGGTTGGGGVRGDDWAAAAASGKRCGSESICPAATEAPMINHKSRQISASAAGSPVCVPTSDARRTPLMSRRAPAACSSPSRRWIPAVSQLADCDLAIAACNDISTALADVWRRTAPADSPCAYGRLMGSGGSPAAMSPLGPICSGAVSAGRWLGSASAAVTSAMMSSTGASNAATRSCMYGLTDDGRSLWDRVSAS